MARLSKSLSWKEQFSVVLLAINCSQNLTLNTNSWLWRLCGSRGWHPPPWLRFWILVC
jgi:hypothetical protein